jgi:hypothetical protein
MSLFKTTLSVANFPDEKAYAFNEISDMVSVQISSRKPAIVLKVFVVLLRPSSRMPVYLKFSQFALYLSSYHWMLWVIV